MREQGYYWISVGGGEPQIADYWIDKISGKGEWTTAGIEDSLMDDPLVEVLSERLLPPEKKP